MRRNRGSDDDDSGRGRRGVDQNKVYFECEVCGHTFQDEPNKDFQTCPQCGSDESTRV
ncbi:MAG: hypothetical protein SV760_03480 [Halobacteria archaeon]|nr:hypothetical protein [Halobacteria archaeon]